MRFKSTKERGRALEGTEAESQIREYIPGHSVPRGVGGTDPHLSSSRTGGYKDRSGGRARCSEWGDR